jgi:hypothetical protein
MGACGALPALIHRAAVEFDTPQSRAASRTEPPGMKTGAFRPSRISPSRQPFSIAVKRRKPSSRETRLGHI